jgi:threonine aldolase
VISSIDGRTSPGLGARAVHLRGDDPSRGKRRLVRAIDVPQVHFAAANRPGELEPSSGLEPETYGLRNRCSTTELRWRTFAYACSRAKGERRCSNRVLAAQVAGVAAGAARMLESWQSRRMIDLRSDTLTLPTAAMRRAMAEAELGDDVYGEDPTARRLQERAAELLGKPAALFVPSGTMANQLALLGHCERGNDVLTGEGNHCVLYESGAGAAWAQVNFSVVGRGGLFSAAEMLDAIKPPEYHFPQTRLVAIENTHNRSGGRVFPQADVIAIGAAAHAQQLAVHLDGARIWNAAVATGLTPSELAAPADSVSACFSKGLGAPIGSVLAGSVDFIRKAHRYRKMLGGGMRQIGVLCAAALYALDHHRERLAEDHAHARRLAVALAELPGFSLDLASVQTNVVAFDVRGMSAREFVQRAAAEGVRLNALGPARLRAVTHIDVAAADIDTAVLALARVLRHA